MSLRTYELFVLLIKQVIFSQSSDTIPERQASMCSSEEASLVDEMPGIPSFSFNESHIFVVSKLMFFTCCLVRGIQLNKHQSITICKILFFSMVIGKMMLEDNTSADVQVLFDFLDNELDYAPFVSIVVRPSTLDLIRNFNLYLFIYS